MSIAHALPRRYYRDDISVVGPSFSRPPGFLPAEAMRLVDPAASQVPGRGVTRRHGRRIPIGRRADKLHPPSLTSSSGGHRTPVSGMRGDAHPAGRRPVFQPGSKSRHAASAGEEQPAECFALAQEFIQLASLTSTDVDLPRTLVG